MFGNWIGGLKTWLAGGGSEDNRRAARYQVPSVLVHYWDGSVPDGRRLRDISNTGAFIVTNETWYPGTIVRLILQGHDTLSPTDTGAGSVPSITTTISSRVVRQDADGVAVEFLFPTQKERDALENFLATIPKAPENANRTNQVKTVTEAL